MATLAPTDHSSPVAQVRRDSTPGDAVREVISRPEANRVQMLCFDLSDWPAEAVARWNEEFIERYDEATSGPGDFPLPPSAVVFGDQLDLPTRELLRRAGAVVYDRSVKGTPHSGQDLLAYLQKTQGILPYAQLAATPALGQLVSQVADDLPRVDPKADPTAFNDLPPGVSEDDVDRWIEAMNKG